jgi:hypothetical protein
VKKAVIRRGVPLNWKTILIYKNSVVMLEIATANDLGNFKGITALASTD